MTASEAAPDDTAAEPPALRSGLLRGCSRAAIVAVFAVFAIAGTYAVYCGAIIYQGNFRVVQPGVLYRSAQLSGSELKAFAQRYGIKSVLNLRGPNPGSAWYDSELATARDIGIAHYDFGLSARRVVAARQIAQLLAIVKRAPKPLLIHCESGADRSGLVAALYDYAIRGENVAEADRQLSLAHGHFPYLTSRTGAMDASFWAFVHTVRAARHSADAPTQPAPTLARRRAGLAAAP